MALLPTCHKLPVVGLTAAAPKAGSMRGPVVQMNASKRKEWGLINHRRDSPGSGESALFDYVRAVKEDQGLEAKLKST